MSEPALTKTLTDGRTATVTRHTRQQYDTIAISWDVAIDGQPYTSGSLHKRPDPEGKGPAIWAIGTAKVLGLSDAEHDVLQAVLVAERDAWLETPHGEWSVLRTTVELASVVRTSAAENAADTGEGWDEVVRSEAVFDAALKALEAFEAAHPELVAEREAQGAKETERAMKRAFTD